MKAISQDEIRVLSQYVYTISGVALDAGKAYLLETRLKPLVQKYGATSYLDLHAKAITDRSGELEKEIIDAITTNETLFFRDNSPFEAFKHKILPDLIDARSRSFPGRPVSLRIWSAACSTGQEVYSIAMALQEVLGSLDRHRISILGTDISSDAVAKASYGQYSKFEIERGLPLATLRKYFTATGDSWRIKDELRSLATFKKFNLMRPFIDLGPFDVIFCRNVAIYFTPADKKTVFEKMATVLQQDGSFIIGSTESLTGITSVFEPKRYMRATFYQLAGLTPASAPPSIRPAMNTAPLPTAARPEVPVPTTLRPVATTLLPKSVLSVDTAKVVTSAPSPPTLVSPEPLGALARSQPPQDHQAAALAQTLAKPDPAPQPLPAQTLPRIPLRAPKSAAPVGDKSDLKRRLMEKKQAAKAGS